MIGTGRLRPARTIHALLSFAPDVGGAGVEAGETVQAWGAVLWPVTLLSGESVTRGLLRFLTASLGTACGFDSHFY